MEKVPSLFKRVQAMSEMNDKGAERQAKLKNFLKPGSGDAELQAEIVRLREEVADLKEQLLEREAHIQNLFAHIHSNA